MGRVLDMRGAPVAVPEQKPIPAMRVMCPKCGGGVFQLLTFGIMAELPISHERQFQPTGNQVACVRCRLVLPSHDEIVAARKRAAEEQSNAGVLVNGAGAVERDEAAGG